MENQEQKENKALLASLAVLVIGCIVLAIIGFFFLNKPDELLEGQADATSVKVSGKLPGRVAEIFVKEGDFVHAGDTLVHIHSSLAEARLMQAEGMQTVAQTQENKIDAGTRSQIIQSARDLVNQANAALNIAQKTYTRMENLYKEGVVSEQKRDEAKAAYDGAVSAKKVAESQLSLALAGAQKQDKESAAAMVNVAKGGVAEVQSLLEDQYLTAPCDGQVDQIYPEVSELVAIGTPIINILKDGSEYVIFNVREELLNDLPMGKEIEVMVPALDRKHIKAKVYYVRDMGSYATWRSTKSNGSWDSRTFQIKARPTEAVENLRPGMSIIYEK